MMGLVCRKWFAELAVEFECMAADCFKKAVRIFKSGGGVPDMPKSERFQRSRSCFPDPQGFCVVCAARMVAA